MNIISVEDLLRVIDGDERICVDLNGGEMCSETMSCHDFHLSMNSVFLGARVTRVWRSVYFNRIVIEAEV